MKKRSILIVDDDAVVSERLRGLLERRRFAVETLDDAQAAIELVRSRTFDAVLMDVQLPGVNGIDLIGEIHAIVPEIPVVMITAFGSMDTAIEALRAGAFDYLLKPIQPADLTLSLERAIRMRALEEENERLRASSPSREEELGELVAASPAMRGILSLVARIAASESSVLILGESGTGKDLIAQTLHDQSPRRDARYVPVNCAAIPEDLLESELFGHVRGAFSGAHANKEGLFQRAEGGTLFLDEIGEMGPGLQSKLLRVLQDGKVRPVGATDAVRVDVRVVAATNQDLRRAIQEGRFRADLFYRLNVIPIHLPALRERPEDIEPLAGRILQQKCAAGQRPRLTEAALARLRTHRWPGNVRELQNTLERTVALSQSPVIDADDLAFDDWPELPKEQADGLAELLASAAEEEIPLRTLEDRYISEVLRRTGNNKLHAARILGVNRTTLYRRTDS